jgi:hypothetical protein
MKRRIGLSALFALVPGAALAQSVDVQLDDANQLVTWGLIAAGVLIVASIVFTIISHSIKLLFALFLLALIVGGGLVWYGASQGIDIAKENNLEYELGPFFTVKVPTLEGLELPDLNLPNINVSFGN